MSVPMISWPEQPSQRQMELIALARLWWRNGHNSNETGEWPSAVCEPYKLAHDWMVEALAIEPDSDYGYRVAAYNVRAKVEDRGVVSPGANTLLIAVRQVWIGIDLALCLYIGDIVNSAR